MAQSLPEAQPCHCKFQRQALGYYRSPGKKRGVAPGRDVFYTLLGRVEPQALAAVLNAWLQV